MQTMNEFDGHDKLVRTMAAGKLMRYAWMHMSGRARYCCIKNDIKYSTINLILHFLLIHLVV